MSVQGVQWALATRGIEPAAKLILCALGDRHNKDTNLCCPDQVMLAEEVGMTDRTVRTWLGWLALAGMISRRKLSKGHGVVTYYTLHFDRQLPLPVETNRKTFPVGTTPKKTSTKSRVPSGSGFPVGKRASGGTYRKSTVRPTGNGFPVHIEEPEGTRSRDRSVLVDRSSLSHSSKNDDATKNAFEALWETWPPHGRRRSKSKSKCYEVFRRAISTCDQSEILDAARAFLKTINLEYAMGLDRWLREGRFEHFVAPKVSPAAQTELQFGDPWAPRVAAWRKSGHWPGPGAEPTSEHSIAPTELILDAIKDFPPDHPVARDCRRAIEIRKRA